jgi:lycopene beta-cyclase
MKTHHTTYDIVFSGFGASSCILINQLHKNKELDNKRILILDPLEKKTNDKTFCFWANPEDDIVLDYQQVLTHSWSKVNIDTSKTSEITPFKYHHLNSEGLYQLTKNILKGYDVTFSNEIIERIDENTLATLWTKENRYTAQLVFDSRPPKTTKNLSKKQNIWQSFVGYKVQMNGTPFDESACTLMDFNVDQQGATQFVYVLPFSNREALIELTRFGKEIIDQESAEKVLKSYISQNYGEFSIKEVEKGKIPMFMDLPKSVQTQRIIPIGTRAHMVKPSTGYAFKNMYRHAQQLSANVGQSRTQVKSPRRFQFYDRLLILILAVWPKMGKPIFSRLFASKPLIYILRFLDEKTGLREDVSMFSKLQIGVFLRAVVYLFVEKNKPFVLLFFPVILFFCLELCIPEYSQNIMYLLIFIGLFLVGIPHGAMDHKTGLFSDNKKINLSFIFKYLGVMSMAYLVWLISPTVALVTFILYSAWHFGETDIQEWKINSRFVGFLWGLIMFSALFFSHVSELNVILKALSVQQLPLELPWLGLFFWSLTISFLLARLHQSLPWLLLTCFLALSYWLPLVMAFAIYFVFHHSWSGWKHLRTSFKVSNWSLFKTALPFNLGAFVLFVVLFLNTRMGWDYNIAQIFIFISCISLPHILSMSYFYKKLKTKRV